MRPSRGGKLGGVSAAIGHRYGIDPVLVRVAFVVTTFYGGAGILLYLLGWLLLPKEGSSTSTPMIVLLALLLIPCSYVVSDVPGLVGLALGGLALYLLHRNYGDHRPADSATEPPTEPPTESATESATESTAGPAVEGANNTWVYPTVRSGATGTTESGREDPPSWDPLGTAPFAWDLPEPEDPPPEPAPSRPRRRSVTLVTLAIMLLALGFGTAFGLPPAITTAVGLGVLGLGMLAGAFLHGGRGLIVPAVPMAVLALAFNALPADTWHGVGDQQVRPAGVAEIRDDYRKSVGNIELHLDDLRFPAERTITTGGDVGAGNISVYLPPNVDVRAKCSADMGQVNCLGRERQGDDISATAFDEGADGRGGGQLVLDLHAGTGNVEVLRG